MTVKAAGQGSSSVAERAGFEGDRRGWRAGGGASRLARVLAAMVLGWVGAVAVAARPALAATFTTPQPVPGTIDLAGVACPSPVTCVAVGNNSSGQGVVVVITNGIPGSAVVVPGTFDLTGVACPSTTSCVAVGQTPVPNLGAVVLIANGVVGAAQAVPGTSALAGVACSSATTCVGVGEYVKGSNTGVVVPITNGTPGSAQAVSGTANLGGVACPSPSTCEAVGGTSIDLGVVVPITNGTPGSVLTVPGSVPVGLAGVACPSTTACVAVGENNPSGGSTAAVVVPITNGVPGAPRLVPGITGLHSVACPRATCQAVGDNFSLTVEQGVLVPITNATPGAGKLIPGIFGPDSVACPTVTTCVAVSEQPGLPSDQGVVLTITNPLRILPVTVNGSQTSGSSSPSFTTAASPPAGDAFTGSLRCTAVANPAMAISPALPAGTYPLNGASCSGLTLTGPTASDYQVVYSGTFTVSATIAPTTAVPELEAPVPTPVPTLALTGETDTLALAAAAGLIIVVLGGRQLGRRLDS